jgi:signal transduction histidine kinase
MIIRGRAEALLERPLEDALAADLRSVLRQIDQISGVIGRVLDFSRAQPVEVRPTDAVAAARAAGELLGWRFRAKALGFDVEVADEAPLPPIAADPDQLQQVFVNLLLNACDASSPKQRIVVRLAAAGARARIEVVDEGCGVAPEQLNAIFDPFFTTKKRGEGTGLGLPVVASIVRNHGAEIAVASAPGAGTTVTLSWPVAKPAGAAVA